MHPHVKTILIAALASITVRWLMANYPQAAPYF